MTVRRVLASLNQPVLPSRDQAVGAAVTMMALFGIALTMGATVAAICFRAVDAVVSFSPDDAYSYPVIALHAIQGRFSTFDGLTRTNGYHPLWEALLTLIVWALPTAM